MTKNTPFKLGYVALSSLGYGGANAHVVVKPTNLEQTNCKTLPNYKNRLVLASGRTPEAVSHFLDGIEKNQDDHDFLCLVDEIHKINIDRHEYRG